MKKVLVLMAGILFAASNLYAGNGDLIVNGNLGVGAANPTLGKIQIQQPTSDYALYIENTWGTAPSTAAKGLFVRTAGNDGDDIILNLQGYNTDVMRVLGNGNVGIGTANPATYLDGTFGLSVYHSTSPGISVGNANSGYLLYIDAANNNNFTFYDSMANLNRMSIDTTGRVGIGTTNPQWTLDVNGSAHNLYGVWSTSDIKFKKDILPIDNALDKILKLGGVSFEWILDKKEAMSVDSSKADDSGNKKDKKHPEDGRHYGMIAQEIEKVLPEVVKEDEEGNKAVAYTEIIPVLIEAMKEQQKQITGQQKRIEELEKKVAQLK